MKNKVVEEVVMWIIPMLTYRYPSEARPVATRESAVFGVPSVETTKLRNQFAVQWKTTKHMKQNGRSKLPVDFTVHSSMLQ